MYTLWAYPGERCTPYGIPGWEEYTLWYTRMGGVHPVYAQVRDVHPVYAQVRDVHPVVYPVGR